MPKITQLVKGIHCNANCPMCLSLRNKGSDVPSEANLIEPYSNYDLLEAYYKALDTGSTELVITSYGDPLVNGAAFLPNEIEMARKAGFKQVTLITNGAVLSPECSRILARSGLTHLSLSIHALDNKTYQITMGNRNFDLQYTLQQGLVATEHGLVVRHNYVWNSTLTLNKVISQSKKFGAQQVTLIESVPVNNFAKIMHCDLPEVPLRAIHIISYAWGMDIYDLDGVSLALCRFGQDDSDFDEQNKNLYINILSNGEIVLREGAYFDIRDGVFSSV